MLKNVKSECWKFCYIYEIGGSRCSSWWEGCVGTVGVLGGKGPGGEGGECGVGRGGLPGLGRGGNVGGGLDVSCRTWRPWFGKSVTDVVFDVLLISASNSS